MSAIRRALTEGERIRYCESAAGDLSLYRLPDGAGVRVYHSYEAMKYTGDVLGADELAAAVMQWDAIDLEYTVE